MNLRAWAYNAIVNDSAVQAEFPANAVFSAGSLDTQPSVNPFIVITFLPSLPSVKGAKFERTQVWAHDAGGSYVRIDRMLKAVRKALESASSQEGFIAATWEGDSQDTADDAMNTLTRNSTFRLAMRDEA